jgi:hypothetical protein
MKQTPQIRWVVVTGGLAPGRGVSRRDKMCEWFEANDEAATGASEEPEPRDPQA